MRKIKSILDLMIGLMLVLVVNQLINFYPLRIDLTEEKRFSISEATQELLSNIEEPVYVEVFLEGEMPAGFKRLKLSIQQVLDQFAYYADGDVIFTFTDPSQASNSKSRNKYYRFLMNKGVAATNLNYSKNGVNTEKLIFPGALLTYLGKETPVMLLKGNQNLSSEERLNQSIEGIEYELASAIRNLASEQKKNIGLIKGHNEPDKKELAGLVSVLSAKYNVYEVNLAGEHRPIMGLDAVMITKPTSKFSELEKFELDQYIMNGGKSLMFLDALNVDMASATGEGTFAFPNDHNLDDMLFKYGVRINKNFVQDIISGEYPIVAGNMGDQAQIRMLPWPFFPIVNNYADHPIVKNLDAISMKFVSTLDTIKSAAGIEKIQLITTSAYSMVNPAPVKVSFNELQKTLNPALFNSGSQAVAYLLKGKFTSSFKNRMLPIGVNKSQFKVVGEETQIFICSDGDVIRNEFDLEKGEPLPLGLSPYNKVTYANADLVLNVLEFMLNEKGIITAKNKEVKIRPLDKVKVSEDSLFWQIFNLGLPIVILIIGGVLRAYYRNKRYARH